MYKKDLVKKLVKRTKESQSDVEKFLNAMLSEVKFSLKRKETVTLKGFGTFHIRSFKKRSIHSVQTGKKLVVPAHKLVGFRPGAQLRGIK